MTPVEPGGLGVSLPAPPCLWSRQSQGAQAPVCAGKGKVPWEAGGMVASGGGKGAGAGVLANGSSHVICGVWCGKGRAGLSLQLIG